MDSLGKGSKKNIYGKFHTSVGGVSEGHLTYPIFFIFFAPNADLITGPVFTAKGCIRPFLGYLGRFCPVFGSQRQYS